MKLPLCRVKTPMNTNANEEWQAGSFCVFFFFFLLRHIPVITLISNGTGRSDNDERARVIVWILFYFDHIWAFALRAPS